MPSKIHERTISNMNYGEWLVDFLLQSESAYDMEACQQRFSLQNSNTATSTRIGETNSYSSLFLLPCRDESVTIIPMMVLTH